MGLISLFTHGFKNMAFNYGVFQEISLIVLLVYAPFLHTPFGTEPITGVCWAIAVPFSFSLWGYDELRKLMLRSYLMHGGESGSFTSIPRYHGSTRTDSQSRRYHRNSSS